MCPCNKPKKSKEGFNIITILGPGLSDTKSPKQADTLFLYSRLSQTLCRKQLEQPEQQLRLRNEDRSGAGGQAAGMSFVVSSCLLNISFLFVRDRLKLDWTGDDVYTNSTSTGSCLFVFLGTEAGATARNMLQQLMAVQQVQIWVQGTEVSRFLYLLAIHCMKMHGYLEGRR